MKQTVGTPPTPRIDRRVARTREALRDALLTLLVERGWDDIDVQTLCDRANIARSTFYLHFPSKEALLTSSFGDLGSFLRAQARHANAAQFGFLSGLLEHVHEQQEVFRAMLARRSGHFVQDRFRELLIDLIQAEVPASARRSWQDQARIHYLAGALFQLLCWWLGAKRPQSPTEVEALFLALSHAAQRD